MKRRDLLKGLLGIPAAIVGAKAVQAECEPKLLDVTNLNTPRGKREFMHPVTLECRQYTAKIRYPKELMADACIDIRSHMAKEIKWTFE